MLGRTYDRENCSAARALEVVGERWSLLIIRNAMFAGMTRFTEFQRGLGVAPNILSSRLDLFIDTGIMRRRADAGRETVEYELTPKGLDLQPVIISLSAWGDRWAAPAGEPIKYTHDACGGNLRLELQCSACAAVVEPGCAVAEPGPGMSGT